ncbi:hypothetical protein [Rubinisphaera margarita]|uniref:hypothetical protein n=1 Tax=Rubinisphaera margarita TaxID=2909586 RepID=UPI001EE9A10B|nr:hypothetical protein [Rubinisphaera margarita]MCG6156776.1 hypothetical protein [Rubinisphaera margarita]
MPSSSHIACHSSRAISVVRIVFILLAILLTPALVVGQTPRTVPAGSKPAPLELTAAELNIQLYVPVRDISAGQIETWRELLVRHLANGWGKAVEWKLDVHARQDWDEFPEERTTSVKDPELHRLGSTSVEVRLSRQSGDWIVESRRWLALTNQWLEMEARTVRSDQLLPIELAAVMQENYGAVVHIRDVDFKVVAGTLMGGELGVIDQSFALLEPGDMLKVLLLYFDRDGNLITRQELPWTYLEVSDRNRAFVEMQIHSAFRNAIPQSRRRVEVMAYQVSRRFGTSATHVSTRGEFIRDFQLARVLVSPWRAAPSAEKTENKDGKAPRKPIVPSVVRFADRNGRFQLKSSEISQELGTELVKLEVMSEDVVVARVPYLLGSEASIDLTVPDDSARVEAETRLGQLKAELLRVTAKRATLMAAIRKLIDEPQEVDPKALFEEMETLPNAELFTRQVTLIRVAAETRLEALGNRVAASQVRKEAEEAQALVNRYLDPEPVIELKVALGIDDPQAEGPATEPGTPQARPKRRSGVVIPQFN